MALGVNDPVVTKSGANVRQVHQWHYKVMDKLGGEKVIISENGKRIPGAVFYQVIDVGKQTRVRVPWQQPYARIYFLHLAYIIRTSVIRPVVGNQYLEVGVR